MLYLLCLQLFRYLFRDYMVFKILIFLMLPITILAQQFAAIVSQTRGNDFVINEKEETIFIPPIDMELKTINEGILRVKKNGKYSYLSCYGIPLFNNTFEKAEDFFENFARVRVNRKWGYISKRGELTIEPVYQNVFDFSEHRALVKLNGKWGFIDTTGKVIIPLIYDDALSFSCNRAWVKKGGKWGAIDRKGKLIIEHQYIRPQIFTEGVALVRQLEDYGYIDTLNNFLISFNENNKSIYYSDIIYHNTDYIDFPSGIFPNTLDRNFYFKDTDQNFYSYFSDSLLRYFNGKFGFINKNKSKVIEVQFIQATNFYKGYAIVVNNQGYNVINTKGNLLLSKSISNIITVYNDFAVFTFDGLLPKYQYIDLKKRFTFNNKYIRADAFSIIK